MSETHKSLIKASEIQQELLPVTSFEAKLTKEINEGSDSREHTAENLFNNDREKYNMIISLLCEGTFGQIKIGQLLKVSPNTVRAIKNRESEIVDIGKKQLAKLCQDAAHMTMEAIIEDLSSESLRKKIPTDRKGVLLGILVEKFQLLTGSATAIVDSPKDQALHADYTRLLKECTTDAMSRQLEKNEQKEAKTIEAEVSEPIISRPEDRPGATQSDEATPLHPDNETHPPVEPEGASHKPLIHKEL